MKKLLSILLFLSLSTLLVSQENWIIDNAHSNLRFEVGWEDFSTRTGEFKSFDGLIITNSLKDLSNAELEFTVETSSVDVIADRLAEHIMSEKFLNVKLYPEIKYVSNSLESTSDSTYVSTGLLRICGIEKEQKVSIEVKGFKETKKGNIFGIQVNLVVDRTQFDLTWGTPRLGNNITIVGHLLYKVKKEESTSK